MIYKNVDLGDSEELIRSYVLKNFVTESDKTSLVNKSISLEKNPRFSDFLYENLTPFFDLIGKPLKVAGNLIIFGMEPKSVMPIHVDGFELDRKYAKNYALNIPLLNCEKGAMNWFGGDYGLSEATRSRSKLKYLKLTWYEEPIILESVIINSATVVKIDIPHSVVNSSDKYRLMLSIRFFPDIPSNW